MVITSHHPGTDNELQRPPKALRHGRRRFRLARLCQSAAPAVSRLNCSTSAFGRSPTDENLSAVVASRWSRGRCIPGVPSAPGSYAYASRTGRSGDDGGRNHSRQATGGRHIENRAKTPDATSPVMSPPAP